MNTVHQSIAVTVGNPQVGAEFKLVLKPARGSGTVAVDANAIALIDGVEPREFDDLIIEVGDGDYLNLKDTETLVAALTRWRCHVKVVGSGPGAVTIARLLQVELIAQLYGKGLSA